jgi:phage terminase small subunit
MLSNIRHERFAHGIAQGKPASRAYIDAGYKARGNSAEVNAARLLRKAQVQHRIEQLAEEIKNEAIADAEELQRFLTTVVRGVDAKGEEPTEDHVTKDGFVVQVRPSFRDKLKAAELLFRVQGAFNRTEGAGDGELAAIAAALEQPRSVN